MSVQGSNVQQGKQWSYSTRYRIIHVLSWLFGRLIYLILVDLVNILAESNFEVIYTLDWIKLTSRENLLKTKGYYLQHCKETLIVARRQDVRAGDVSSSSCDRLSPDFIQERQVLSWSQTAECYDSFGNLVR